MYEYSSRIAHHSEKQISMYKLDSVARKSSDVFLKWYLIDFVHWLAFFGPAPARIWAFHFSSHSEPMYAWQCMNCSLWLWISDRGDEIQEYCVEGLHIVDQKKGVEWMVDSDRRAAVNAVNNEEGEETCWRGKANESRLRQRSRLGWIAVNAANSEEGEEMMTR